MTEKTEKRERVEPPSQAASCGCFVHDRDDDLGCQLHAATGCEPCRRAQAQARDEGS